MDGTGGLPLGEDAVEALTGREREIAELLLEDILPADGGHSPYPRRMP